MDEIDDAGKMLRSIREAYQHALAHSIQLAREAVVAGTSESEAARRAGVDRMTVRKALGKR